MENTAENVAAVANTELQSEKSIESEITAEKTAEKLEEKTVENLEEKTVEKTEEKTAENTEDKTVENIEEKPVEQEPLNTDISEDKIAVATPANDEFSYLQRNEFTSEIYKIEVRNLGYFGIGEFKKLLKNTLKLDISKIKSPLRRDFAYICLRSQEDQERAIQTLNGYKWKGKELKAFAATASADPLMKRRNEQSAADAAAAAGVGNGHAQPKKPRSNVEATCPLAGMPYDEQLAQKTDEMQKLLKKFTLELKRNNANAKKSLETFEFEGLKASPQVDGYRNKNEFTVGKNSAGEIVVGFRLGSYADGSVEVSAVDALPHLPDAAKWAARTFQQFVRDSKFLPFNPENNSGHYRQLMVRSSRMTGELMLVAGIYSSNCTATELAELKLDLQNFYANCEDTAHKCSSLYYQDVKHREAGQVVNPVEHLAGNTHITDSILELQFRISPLAFFQINTQSANVLYEQAIALAAPQPHTTMLDICCGTGTIALAFAKHCKRVLGVEIIADAIKDAEHNAAANNIENCKFYAGNADDYIQSMVKEVVYGCAPGEQLDLVAIVDPPRNGLHLKSITAIRAAKAIKRLVYIACNPARAQRNWLDLARPESKQYKGDSFYPKKAVAVDMFPHTTHTEMVILFERQPEAEEAVVETTAQVTVETAPKTVDESVPEVVKKSETLKESEEKMDVDIAVSETPAETVAAVDP